MTTKRCSRCKEFLPVERFNKKGDRFQSRCRPCNNAASNEVFNRRRAEVVALLGGRCKHCGITDTRVLQIDHIAGGGTAEVRRIRYRSMLRKIIESPDGYQVLCANCNWIKRHENEESKCLLSRSRSCSMLTDQT